MFNKGNKMETLKGLDILKEEIATGKFKWTIRKLIVGGRKPESYETHGHPYYIESLAVAEANSYAMLQRLPQPQITEAVA